MVNAALEECGKICLNTGINRFILSYKNVTFFNIVPSTFIVY